MTLAQRPEVLAGVRWIVMAASRHASRWLAVWPVTGTAIVMPGLEPGIHALSETAQRRGWPGQARP
jgi:hypothetical protein